MNFFQCLFLNGSALRPNGIRAYGAGTCSGGFVGSVQCANIYADNARTSDASGAVTLYVGKCELAPTTAAHTHAQVKYSRRFRAAYGHYRSRVPLPDGSSASGFPALSTAEHRHTRFPLTVTSLARPRRRHRWAIQSFTVDNPLKPNYPSPRHERRQDKQSRHRRTGRTANMCTIVHPQWGGMTTPLSMVECQVNTTSKQMRQMPSFCSQLE